MIGPERPVVAGEDAFRFRHLLIRDAAYDSLPKAARADLHLRFAAWMSRQGADLVELDEIVGYHLEQALHYQAELGLARDEAVTAAAVRHLSAAGGRANDRGDPEAAASLLARAVAMLPPGQIDLAAETNLIDALLWGGATDAALRSAESLASRARATGAKVGELCGQIMAGHVRLFVAPGGIADPLEALIRRALPVFQAADERVALHVAYFTLAWVKQLRGGSARGSRRWSERSRIAPSGPAISGRGAAAHAWMAPCPSWTCSPGWTSPSSIRCTTPGSTRTGHTRWRCSAASTRPVPSSPRRGPRWQSAGADSRWRSSPASTRPRSNSWRAIPLRPQTSPPRGAASWRAWVSATSKPRCSLAWPASCASSTASTMPTSWWSASGGWARATTARQGAGWRQAKAVLLARRGHHAEAEEHVRAAVAIAETTDLLNNRADAYADLAEVLALGGKADEATEALEQALERYERKENLVMARRTRDRLAAVAAHT